jgi:O-antigen/teichoic acid export membrane protein
MLIKVFPNLLAGFNQLSQKEKENALRNGLPTFAFIVFSAMGLITIAGYFVSIYLGEPSMSQSIYMIVWFACLVVLIFFGNILANKRIE